MQVLSKTMDSTTLSPDKIELSTVRRNEDNDEVGPQLEVKCFSLVTTQNLLIRTGTA